MVGDPIAQSKSPTIHNFWLAKLGIDAEYRRCHVRADELGDYFARRRGDAAWRGCNVTMPHKVAVVEQVDAVDPDARKIGAINTIIHRDARLAGVNTDDVGFIDPLRQFPATLQTATLIGAGGAARAILCAMDEMGIGNVTLVNRNQATAFELASAFPIVRSISRLEGLLELESCDLVVNATSLGMSGKPALPISLVHQPSHSVIYDIVYSPLRTELLAQAELRGLVTIDGLAMLIGQAAAAFQFFFDHPAPREHDAELRALLTA
ncbi:MAG: shikimate dehydrogenase [Novosphingobium sp.]